MDDPAWHKLEGVDANSPSFPARAKFNGVGILIFRIKDGYRGIERACPHLHATMFDAIVMGNGSMIRCARHSYTFKLDNGKGVNCPGYNLQVYEVKSEDGSLFARAVAPPVAAPAPTIQQQAS